MKWAGNFFSCFYFKKQALLSEFWPSILISCFLISITKDSKFGNKRKTGQAGNAFLFPECIFQIMWDILKGKAILIGHVKHSLRQKVIAKRDQLNNIQTVVAGRKSGSSWNDTSSLFLVSLNPYLKVQGFRFRSNLVGLVTSSARAEAVATVNGTSLRPLDFGTLR